MARLSSGPGPRAIPGRLRRGHLPGSTGILDVLEKSMPIGIASAIGRTEGHQAVRTRLVHDAGVPRRSVIILGWFMSPRPGQQRASLNSPALPVAQTMILSSSGNSSPGSASRCPVHESDPPHLDASSTRRLRQHSANI